MSVYLRDILSIFVHLEEAINTYQYLLKCFFFSFFVLEGKERTFVLEN